MSLNVVPTSTQGIENAATDFHLRLSDIVRAIGRYDGTAETSPELFMQVMRRSGQAMRIIRRSRVIRADG